MTGSTSTVPLLRSITLELEADIATVLSGLPHEEIRRLIGRLVDERSVHSTPDESPDPQRRSAPDVLPLTLREVQVLTLIASGYTREEVGAALAISRNTAATHVATIYRKLDIGSIAEATRIAIEYGVVRLV